MRLNHYLIDIELCKKKKKKKKSQQLHLLLSLLYGMVFVVQFLLLIQLKTTGVQTVEIRFVFARIGTFTAIIKPVIIQLLFYIPD